MIQNSRRKQTNKPPNPLHTVNFFPAPPNTHTDPPTREREREREREHQTLSTFAWRWNCIPPRLLQFCDSLSSVSPWYDLHGWLDVECQISISNRTLSVIALRFQVKKQYWPCPKLRGAVLSSHCQQTRPTQTDMLRMPNTALIRHSKNRLSNRTKSTRSYPPLFF